MTISKRVVSIGVAIASVGFTGCSGNEPPEDKLNAGTPGVERIQANEQSQLSNRPPRLASPHTDWSWVADGRPVTTRTPTVAQNPRNRLTHKEGVNSVAFSPDGKTLASGSNDKTIKLWDVETGQELTTLNGPDCEVSSVAFSPDGKTLAAGYSWNSIVLWNVVTGRQRVRFDDFRGLWWSLAFSPDGKTLAEGSGAPATEPKGADLWVRLWNTETGKLQATFEGHRDSVQSVAFSPDGKTLVSSCMDRTIKLWDVESDRLRATLKGHKGCVSSVAFSPDGKTLASASDDNTIKLWDMETATLTATFGGHSGGVFWVAYSPNGKTLASTGGWDKTIKLWDAATGRELATLKGHTATVTPVAFSPDGKTLASGSDDKTIKLWDVAARRERVFEPGRE